MKQTDNRQNKLIQIKAQLKSAFRPQAPGAGPAAGESPPPGIRKGGAVYGLVSNLLAAAKMAQAAKRCHLDIHNFDKAAPLLERAKQKRPSLVIVDWDGCEAEGFKVLKELAQNADLKGVPVAGYVSQAKASVKEEAQRAGCHRVYPKTEFMKSIETLLARYAS